MCIRDRVGRVHRRHRTVVDIRRRVEVGEVVASGEYHVFGGETVIDAGVDTVVVQKARSRAEVIVRIAQADASLVRRGEIFQQVRRDGVDPAGGNLVAGKDVADIAGGTCLLYTSPSPRDRTRSRMP